MRNERGDITIKAAEIKIIIRAHYEQSYAKEFDNLEEMDKS